MTITERLERSKIEEKSDFNKITCLDDQDPLVKVRTTEHIKVEPIWIVPVDRFEGPLYQEYMATHPKYDAVFLRQEVVRRLYQVGQSLPKHLSLLLRSGHRPLEVQNKLLDQLKQDYLAKHPGASPAKVLEFARTFISDPLVKTPPHCCGAAVDVDVFDIESGKLVDFGCPVNTDSDIAFLHTHKITHEQRQNRTMLLEAMLKAGFASCSTEWWHYSYGDQAWAIFYHKPQSLYAVTEPNL